MCCRGPALLDAVIIKAAVVPSVLQWLSEREEEGEPERITVPRQGSVGQGKMRERRTWLKNVLVLLQAIGPRKAHVGV